MHEGPPAQDDKLLRKHSGVRRCDHEKPPYRVEMAELSKSWNHLIDVHDIAKIEPSKLVGMDVFNQSDRENDLLLKIARNLANYIHRYVLKFKQPPASPLIMLTPAAETPASTSYTD